MAPRGQVQSEPNSGLGRPGKSPHESGQSHGRRKSALWRRRRRQARPASRAIYTELKGSTLAGVYDIDRSRAAEIAGRHGCRAFGSLQELGTACDAVSIVTPTGAHAATALSLLANG